MHDAHPPGSGVLVGRGPLFRKGRQIIIMGLYLAPEYFQTIHYYFFCLGIISFSSMFMFWSLGIYSYIFVAFYAAHSAIAWYVSLFLFSRVRNVFVVNTWRYVINHVVLIVFSVGVAAGMWYLSYAISYSFFEAVLTSLMEVNFFAIFMGMSWYILSKFRFVERLFDWIRSGDLRKARGIMLEFRKKNGLRLVDEDIVHRYSRGTSGKIDALFMQAKLQHDNKEMNQLPGTMRHIETALAEERIGELEKKIRDIESGTVSGTDRQLVKTYQNLILSYTKKMTDYDEAFKKKFP